MNQKLNLRKRQVNQANSLCGRITRGKWIKKIPFGLLEGLMASDDITLKTWGLIFKALQLKPQRGSTKKDKQGYKKHMNKRKLNVNLFLTTIGYPDGIPAELAERRWVLSIGG